MPYRGEFTPRIANKMKAFLGRDSSKTELQLYPYLCYVMVNDQKLDPAKINQEEREILRLLKDADHIEGGAAGLAMTKEFWDFAQDIIWDSYVAHRETMEYPDPTPSIDPKTGRYIGDHGTHEDVIKFLLDDQQAPGEEMEFLRAWNQGDLEEWPEYYEWLARENR